MTRERFFIDQPPAGLESVLLHGDEAHHLRDVRRVKPGDVVVLFDGSGTDYVGRVEGFDRTGAVAVRIVAPERPQNEPAVAVTLAVSVIKQAAMDQLVDMCTQLGVKRIVPMRTARTVVKPRQGKSDRWRRIAIEACKQCSRSVVPDIADLSLFESVILTVGQYDFASIGALRPDARPLSGSVPCPCKSALCLIGPEGDFTDGEMSAAIGAGCVPVRLSKGVLRAETAAAVALAMIIDASV